MPATPPFVNVPLTNGQTIAAQLGAVAYVRQDPSNANRCYFGTYSQEPTEPWHVALSADAFTALVAGASGSGPFAVGPLWAWPAGSGYAQFGAPINAGWDVTPATYGTVPGDYVGGEVLHFEADATVDSLSVRPMLATIPNVGGLRRAVATAKVFVSHGPGGEGIGSGLGLVNVGASHGLFVVVRVDGTANLLWDVLRWDGGSTMVLLASTTLGAMAANVAQAWVRVSFQVEPRAGLAPRVALLAEVESVGDGFGTTTTFESTAYVTLDAPPPSWVGVDLDQCAWVQTARAFPTLGIPFTSYADASDLGVWPRIEGGLKV
jgi:hypothetical protein